MLKASKTPCQEIERKFLINALPEAVNTSASYQIEQGYAVIAPDGAEVRLRKKDGKYYVTIKSGSGKIRKEHETEISAVQFNRLWPATVGKRLKKTRYEIFHQGRLIELDVFQGPLNGLIIAEVEFTTLKESDKFKPPSWFGKEVTSDTRYSNQSLALRGKP